MHEYPRIALYPNCFRGERSSGRLTWAAPSASLSSIISERSTTRPRWEKGGGYDSTQVGGGVAPLICLEGGTRKVCRTEIQTAYQPTHSPIIARVSYRFNTHIDHPSDLWQLEAIVASTSHLATEEQRAAYAGSPVLPITLIQVWGGCGIPGAPLFYPPLLYTPADRYYRTDHL